MLKKFLFICLFSLIFSQNVEAAKSLTTLSATAQNTYSDSAKMHGMFNICVSGTWNATVTVQKSFDSGSTWHDVTSYTSNICEVGTEPESGILWRIGVKTGEFTSGTVVGRISQ